MRRAYYHLLRYRDVIPTTDASGPPRLPTQTDRWRLSLCALGAKMEYVLLPDRARSRGIGSQWASGLATALAEIRPLFPPTDDAGFRAWDPAPLLDRLRRAEHPRRDCTA